MVYRLQTGRRSHAIGQWRSMALTLLITVGFPVLGALVWRQDLIPGMTNTVQNDSPGVVLGDTTTSAPDSGENQNTNAVSRPVATTPARSLQSERNSSAPLQVSEGGQTTPPDSSPPPSVSPEPTPDPPAPEPEEPIIPPLEEPPVEEPPLEETPTADLEVEVTVPPVASLEVSAGSGGISTELTVL